MDEKNCKLCFRLDTKMVWCNDFMRNNLRVRKKEVHITHNYFQMLLSKGKPTQDAGALKCNFCNLLQKICDPLDSFSKYVLQWNQANYDFSFK